MLALNLRQEHWTGLVLVLGLHGAALYGLWSLRIPPAPDDALTVMVNLVNPALPEKPNVPPKAPKRMKIQKPRPIEAPKPQQLVAENAIALPNEELASPPSPAPAPPAAAPAPPAPPAPVALSAELSVSCPERSSPTYPAFSVRENEQGRVVLRVELSADGRIASVAFETHSGYFRLDEAAVNAVKTWRCKPALRGGIAVPAVALQPFDFVLQGN